jgi:hypothetical protein
MKVREMGVGMVALVIAACAGAGATGGAAGGAATGMAGGGAVLSLGAGDANPDALRQSVEARVGIPDLGPARVERVWQWNVGEAQPVVVWVTCRGSGDTRACAVAAGRIGGGNVQVLGVEAAGWSVPQLSETADRRELLIAGDDGRGAWRQQLRYAPEGGGAVAFGRRMYADGM